MENAFQEWPMCPYGESAWMCEFYLHTRNGRFVCRHLDHSTASRVWLGEGQMQHCKGFRVRLANVM